MPIPASAQVVTALIAAMLVFVLVLTYSSDLSTGVRVVVVAIGAPLAFVLLLYPEWAAAAYVASTPLDTLSASAGGIGSIPMLVGCVFAGSLALNLAVGRRCFQVSRRHLAVASLWFGWLAFSTAMDADAVFSDSLRSWGFRAQLLNFVAYVCVSSATFSVGSWRKAVVALVSGATILALWAPGVLQVSTARGFEQSWLPNSHPSGYGFTLSTVLLLLWPIVLLHDWPAWTRLLVALAAPPCVYALAKSANQQSVVGGVVGGVVAWALLLAWTRRVADKAEGQGVAHRRLSPGRIMAGGAVALVLVLLFLAVTRTWDTVAAGVYYRFRTEVTGPLTDSSGSGRIGLWSRGLQESMQEPFYGGGVYSGHMLHNDFLQMFSDGGIVLLLLWSAFLLLHGKGIFKIAPRSDGTISYRQALLRAAFGGAMASYIFQSSVAPLAFHKVQWVFWALVVYLPRHAAESEEDDST